MVKFKAFSRLKNIFLRFNPLFSFDFDNHKVEISKPLSSNELLERTIIKCPEFMKVVLIAIYHLINTNGENKEYLTVLTKDNKLLIDLIEGRGDNVSVPPIVKVEGKKGNILVACHNHFLGAIIPSLDDVATAINNYCPFVAIVSGNHIGILIIESDGIDCEKFENDFEWFREYIGFCIDVEKGQEIDEIDMMDISEEKREEMKSIIHDKFLADNVEKFVNEFNNRFNKYKIYELYIIV